MREVKLSLSDFTGVGWEGSPEDEGMAVAWPRRCAPTVAEPVPGPLPGPVPGLPAGSGVRDSLAGGSVSS